MPEPLANEGRFAFREFNLASPAVAVPDTAASVDSAASSRLAEALSAAESGATTPAVQPPATPEPPAQPQAAQPQTSPETASAPPVPAPNNLIDTSKWSPEAKRALEMEGGDPAKLAERYLEFNNRLATYAKEQPAQVETPAAPEPPAAPVEIDPQQVRAKVAELLTADHQVTEWSRVHAENVKTLDGIRNEIADVEKKLNIERVKQGIPQLASDPLQAERIETDILRYESRLLHLQTREDFLARKNADLDSAYSDKAWRLHREIEGSLQKQALDAQQQKAAADRIDAHAKALETAWPSALQAVGVKHNLPPKTLEKLNKRAQDAALANLDRGITVKDAETFLNEQAEAYIQELDEHHRERSAQYALQATARAAATQPSTTGAPSVAREESPQIKDISDLYKRTDARLKVQLGIR